jgi:hypothetical protein
LLTKGSDSIMDLDDISFTPGFQWAGSFVKLAQYRGRPLSFRLSPQLVANCFEPTPGAVGPVKTVEAHEPVIELACRQAMHRLRHSHPMIDLRREDFEQAA